MDQFASASEGSAVYQAGGDITVNHPPPPPARAWKVPPRNPNFTGRDRHLKTLSELLGPTVVVIHGMGGVGKTQLVIEHVHRHERRFDSVWWISAETPALIPDQLRLLAAALGLDLPADAAVPLLLSHLRDLPRWLLVFDNAESVDNIRDFVPPGPVLVTTRRAGFDAIGRVIDLATFDRVESVALLGGRAPHLSDVQADDLAELLGDLPLGLEQASAYLRQTAIPADEYLDLLRRNPDAMAAKGKDNHRSSADASLATVWKLSLTDLARRHPMASEILALCAYLAPEAIPLDLIDKPTGEPGTFSDAIGVLVDYSLARRSSNHLVVHRLVQLAVREHSATEKFSPHPVEFATRLLMEDLPREVFDSVAAWPRWGQLLPHVLSVLGHDRRLGVARPAGVAILHDRAGTYLQMRGQYFEARSEFERALEVLEASFGAEHPDCAKALNNLALLLVELGEPNEARHLIERALLISCADVSGVDFTGVATQVSTLAMVWLELGEPAKALPLLERSLALTEAVCGPDHPQLVIRLGNLAAVLLKLHETSRAREVFERMRSIDDASDRLDDPGRATYLNNFAMLMRQLGDLAEARAILEQVFQLVVDTYGPEHPAVDRARLNLVRVLRDLGETAEADRLLAR